MTEENCTVLSFGFGVGTDASVQERDARFENKLKWQEVDGHISSYSWTYMYLALVNV